MATSTPLSSRVVSTLHTHLKHLFVFLCAFAFIKNSNAQIWNLNANGTWSNSANWTTAVPNGIDAVASFRYNITANRTVTVDVPVILGELILGDTTDSHVYTITGTGGNSITFNVSDPSQMAILRKEASGGNDVISAPIILESGLKIILSNTTSGRVLNLTGSINGGVSSSAPTPGSTAILLQSPTTTSINNQVLVIGGGQANTFQGRIVVESGTLRSEGDGKATLLGATGVGNETIIKNGGRIDLRNHDFHVDTSDGSTEIFHLEGSGWRGLGAMVNSSGTGTVSHILLTGETVIGGTSTIEMRGYLNTSTSQVVNPIFDANGHRLVKLGTNNWNFHDTTFQNLNELVIREGEFRLVGSTVFDPGTTIHIGQNKGVYDGSAFDPLDFTQGSRSQNDVNSTSAGTSSRVGARLEFNGQHLVTHDLNINLYGGAWIEGGGSTTAAAVGSTFITTLKGTINLVSGQTHENGFNLGGGADGILPDNTYVNPGRFVFEGKLDNTSAGNQGSGITKRGNRELRIVTDQDKFNGDFIITGNVARAIQKSFNPTTLQGESVYYNVALAEAGTLRFAKNIELEYGASVSLLNHIAYTDNSTGNINDRINDDGTIKLRSGFLHQITGTEENTENWGHVVSQRGNNIMYFDTRAGGAAHNTLASLTIQEGSVMRFINMNMGTTFGSSASDAVRLAILDSSNLNKFGNTSSSATTDRMIIQGVFGTTVPTTTINPSHVPKDILEGALAWAASSLELMTLDQVGGVEYLRPLTSAEYSKSLADGVNWHIDNGVGVPNTLANAPTIYDDARVNAIKIAADIVPAASREYIYLDAGKKLTIDSGMLLVSHYGSATTGNFETVIRGTSGAALDFNGQKAYIHAGANFYDTDVTTTSTTLAWSSVLPVNTVNIKTRILNSSGLIKTGRANLVLEGANEFSGDSYINDGIVYLRHNESLKGSPNVILNGDGQLYLDRGINVKDTNLVVQVVNGARSLLYNNANFNASWGGDIIIHAVDESGGMISKTHYLNGVTESTLTLYGDIYGTDIPLDFIDHDYFNDPRLITITGGTENTNQIVVNLYGQFKDRVDGALDLKSIQRGDIDGVQYDINHLMRFQMRGNSDVNVNVYNQWDSAGQIDLTNGNFRVHYDPTAGISGFFTDDAVNGWYNSPTDRTVAGLINSYYQRLSLGAPASGASSVTAGTAKYSSSLFLTKSGQVMNNPNIYVYNAARDGNVTLGGENASGTVYYGSADSTGATQARIVIENHGGDRDLRLYQREGGTSVYNLRIIDNGTSVNSSVTKIGRGTARLVDNSAGATSVERWNIMGGVMQWHLTQNGDDRFAVNTAQLILGGGNLEFQHGTNLTSTRAQTLGGALRILRGSSGVSVIRPTGSSANTTTLTLGSTSVATTRAEGSTVHFERLAAAGNAYIVLRGTAVNEILPWATHSTQSGFVDDFAVVDSTNSNRVVGASTKGLYATTASDLDLSTWTSSAKGWSSETASTGFSGVLTSSTSIEGIRFLQSANSGITIADNTTLTFNKGAILNATSVGAFEKYISGGNITSSYKNQAGVNRTELIIHQYNPEAPLNIQSNIVDSAVGTPLSMVFSGVGTTVLSGNNTYTGTNYLIGGTVAIDQDGRLGAANSELYFAGGTLRATQSFELNSNRKITIGGDGATFEVDAGKSLRFGGAIEGEANVIDPTNGYTADIASNQFFGDLTKTGAGELVLTGANNHTNFTGLITIREGTLTISPTQAANDEYANFLGTNHSAMDGLYIESGATLNFDLSYRWRTAEWITFNGMGDQDGGALRISGVAKDLYLNGQLTVETSSLFNITNGANVLVNPGGGNFMGDGDIIRIGNGALLFYGNSTEFRGNVILGSGTTSIRDDAGKFTAAGSFNMRRNAFLHIEHQATSYNHFSDRLNDVAPIYMTGLTKLRMTADGVNQSGMEQLGDLHVLQGTHRLQIYTERSNGAAGIVAGVTYAGMQFNSIQRATGGILKFSVNEVNGSFADKNFGTTQLTDVGVFAVKDISSLEIVGGDGSRGTNHAVVTGAFGGSYIDLLSSTNGTRDAEAYVSRHLMTVETAVDPMTGNPINVIRALRDDEYVKVATNNDAQITSTALGGLGLQSDDNLMLIGRPSSLSDPLTTNLKTSFYTLDQNLEINSLTVAHRAVASYTGSSGSGSGERAELYLGEGVTLTVKSGMLNFASVGVVDRAGADQANTIFNQHTYLLGGKIDFDGREAIINSSSAWFHYNSVNGSTTELAHAALQGTQSDVYISTSLVNMNGFTKTGERSVILSGANEITGPVTVTEGALYLRNEKALGSSTEVLLTGGGTLYVQEGSQIRGVTLRIGELTTGNRTGLALESSSSWWGDIIVDDVDITGQAGLAGGTTQRNIIRAGSAIGAIYGDIYAEHQNAILGASGTTAKLVSTHGMSDGVLYLKGNFKDTANGALSEKVSQANQNEVLRFEVGYIGSIPYSSSSMRSNEEGAVWIENAWDSVGRFSVESGNVHYLGDGNFWTATAQLNMDDMNAMSGFHLGGDISTATVTDQNAAFYLTKAGQNFNIGNIGVGLENDLGNRTGNSTLGALNRNGEVTFGLGTGSIHFDNSNSTSYRRNLRLYQAEGGVSNIQFNFVDGGDLVESSITKVGNGITQLLGSSAGASQLEAAYIMAGELQLGNYSSHANTRLGAKVNTSLGGGALTHLGDQAFTENLGAVTLLAGGSKLNALREGTLTFDGLIDRKTLSTLHFQTKDGGSIFASAYASGAKLGAFAVYGEGDMSDRNATAWATVDGTGRVVGYIHSAGEEDIFGAGLHTDVHSANVLGQDTASLRFNTSGASVGSGSVMLEDGSLLFTSNYDGGIAFASGTTLGAGAGVQDLIFHNYATQDVIIEGQIVANANLVFSGIGTTELRGTVSQVNQFAVIDSAKVRLDNIAQLGLNTGSAVANALYLNGGELIFKGSGDQTLHKNIGITLGAAGGTINLGQDGGRLIYEGGIRSEHNVIGDYMSTFGSTRNLESNPLAGDLTIIGAGVFQIGEFTASIGSANYEGSRTNFYSGLTTVGDGISKTSVQLRGHPANDAYVWPFGTHVGFEDGLLVKNNSELRYQFQRSTTYGSSGTVRLLEWMQFGEKSTDVTYLYNDTGRAIEVAGNVRIHGTLFIHSQNTGIDAGNTTSNGAIDFAVNSGYGGQLLGDANSRVIKTGPGAITFRDNNEHFQGEFEVRRGTVNFYGLGDVAGVGENLILGDREYAAANVGESAIGLVQTSANTIYDTASERQDLHLYQNIQVYGIAASSGSSPNIIRSYLYTDDSSARYHGDIHINSHYDSSKNGLAFILMGGNPIDPVLTGRAQHNWVFVDGNISGSGTGETSILRVNVDDQNPTVRQILYGTTVFSGDNSGWKGELRIAPDNSSIDEYERTLVRFHNDKAISSNNAVNMYRYSTLQVAGSNIHIGNLTTTNGGSGTWVENNALAENSTSTIENAAKTDGYLRVSQTTDSIWYAMFRDGQTPIYFDESATPDGALHVIKDGTGRATLVQANTYTGTTVVSLGNLQVGIGATLGTRAAAESVGRTGTGATTVLSNATLSGTGVVQGLSTTWHEVKGGKLAPGDTGGTSFGTLFIDGNLRVSEGGTLQLQINNPHQYNSGIWTALLDQDHPDYATTLAMLAADPLLADPITSTQYDHLEISGQLSLDAGSRVEITGSGAVISALQAGDVFNVIDWGNVSGARNQEMILPTLEAGLVWEQSLFNTHGILLVTVVPEPSKVLLIAFAISGVLLRRKRNRC